MLNTLNELFDTMLKVDASSLMYHLTEEDNNKKVLTYSMGEYDKNKAWYIIDELGDVNIVLSQIQIQRLVALIEGLRLKELTNQIKMAIIQEKGKDIDDILMVALRDIEYRVKQDARCLRSLNANNLVKELKSTHPNLFF